MLGTVRGALSCDAALVDYSETGLLVITAFYITLKFTVPSVLPVSNTSSPGPVVSVTSRRCTRCIMISHHLQEPKTPKPLVID